MGKTGNPSHDRYDPELLLAYVEDELTEAQRQRCEELFAAAPEIKSLAEGMRADRERLRQLPRAAAPLSVMDAISEQLERRMLLEGKPAPGQPNDSARVYRITQFIAYSGMAALIALAATVVFQTLSTTGPEHSAIDPSLAMQEQNQKQGAPGAGNTEALRLEQSTPPDASPADPVAGDAELKDANEGALAFGRTDTKGREAVDADTLADAATSEASPADGANSLLDMARQLADSAGPGSASGSAPADDHADATAAKDELAKAPSRADKVADKIAANAPTGRKLVMPTGQRARVVEAMAMQTDVQMMRRNMRVAELMSVNVQTPDPEATESAVREWARSNSYRVVEPEQPEVKAALNRSSQVYIKPDASFKESLNTQLQARTYQQAVGNYASRAGDAAARSEDQVGNEAGDAAGKKRTGDAPAAETGLAGGRSQSPPAATDADAANAEPTDKPDRTRTREVVLLVQRTQLPQLVDFLNRVSPAREAEAQAETEADDDHASRSRDKRDAFGDAGTATAATMPEAHERQSGRNSRRDPSEPLVAVPVLIETIGRATGGGAISSEVAEMAEGEASTQESSTQAQEATLRAGQDGAKAEPAEQPSEQDPPASTPAAE